MCPIKTFLVAVVATMTITGCGGDRPKAAPGSSTPASTIVVPTTMALTGSSEPPMRAVPSRPESPRASSTVVSGSSQPRPDPGELEVVDGHIELPAGKYVSSFGVRNIGGEPMMWTALGVPTPLVLETSEGMLDPAQFMHVLVTVDAGTLPPGPFTLEFHISANDTSMPVTVKGDRT